jgi:hypothetical protein
MKYTTHNTVLEIIEKPKWRMRLRDAATGRVLSTRAEHDNDELVNAYFKKGKSFIHKAYVAYINSKGKAMRKNPRSFRSHQWKGVDADLQTSLFEYDFVAVQLPDRDHPDEWLVVYQIGNNAFGKGWIREKDLNDLVDGKEWMKKDDIISFMRTVGSPSVANWKSYHFLTKLSDLTGYFGWESIMGTDYYPLTIKNLLRMSQNLTKRYGPEYLL